MLYLKEAPFEEAMRTVYSDKTPAPLTHNVWTGDFMGMGKHDVPCPVCWERHAIIFHNANPDSGHRQFQPCNFCRAEGWQIVKLPRWLRRFFSPYPR